MMIFHKVMQGRVGMINPLQLQDTIAQTAVNLDVRHGDIRPFKGLGYICDLPKTGDIKTLYKFGEDGSTETAYWFHWAVDVDVAKGPIADDASERTYYSGDGAPKQTDNTMALSGANYPAASLRMGLPAHVSAMIAVASGTVADNPQTETRVYFAVYRNTWGQLSKPSPGVTVTWQTGQVVTLTSIPNVPGGAYDVNAVYIYRSVGSVADAFFVASVSPGAAEYVDSIDTDDLSEPLLSTYWQQPEDDTIGIMPIHGGMHAAFRGKEWMVTDPYYNYAYPIEYRLTLSWDIVGHAYAGNQTVAVLTKKYPYLIGGSSPNSMQEVIVEGFPQTCASKRSIVSVDGGVMYASPAGLCFIGPGSAPSMLTKDILTQAQWQAYKPDSIHAYWHDGRYVAFYDTGAVSGGFIFDPRVSGMIDLGFYASAGYVDPRNNALYLVVQTAGTNQVWKWEGGSTYLNVTVRGKKFRLPQADFFSLVKVMSETYPVTVKLFADDSTTAYETLTVTSDEPTGVGAKRARDWEIEVTANGVVSGVYLAQSLKDFLNA